MMMIVSVLRRTGVFEYVAVWSAKRAGGKPYRLMVMLCVMTAGASALLDNVTTLLLLAPVTFLVCERLGLRAAPYLIAEVMASNIGGTATLIGDRSPATNSRLSSSPTTKKKIEQPIRGPGAQGQVQVQGLRTEPVVTQRRVRVLGGGVHPYQRHDRGQEQKSPSDGLLAEHLGDACGLPPRPRVPGSCASSRCRTYSDPPG